MIGMLPIQASELVPLTTRLLPKELSHAFGIADDTYDSNAEHAPGRAAAAPAPVITSVAITNAQAGSNVAAAQQKRSAPEATARQPAAAAMPAQTATGAANKGQYAAVTQALAVSTPQPAPVHPSSVMQGPSVSQQQATSSISAGLQQQPALQATAAVVGGRLRGFPAAYISPHPLLPYGQQAVAALPHLSGALPVAMYAPADISAVMALQQQQQQQQQHDEAAEELQARALKRPRLVWTPQLHKLFEQAVQKIGVNKAVPKTIMQMMNIEGLTRENVASHLQKYRLSLKKGPDGEFITTVTEGTETSAADGAGSAGGTAGAAAAAAAATADAATTAGNNTSSEAAGDSMGAAAAGAAAGGGERSDAGTGAVAGSRGDAGTEAGSNPAAAAAAAGPGSGGGGTGPAGPPLAQEPKTAAAMAAATEALAAAAAAEGLGPIQAGAGDAGQAAGAAAGGPAAAADG